MDSVSVVTLAKGRPEHLHNLVLGLEPADPAAGRADRRGDAARAVRAAGCRLPDPADRGGRCPAAAGGGAQRSRPRRRRRPAGVPRHGLHPGADPGRRLRARAHRAGRAADGRGAAICPRAPPDAGWRCEAFAPVAVRHSDRRGPPPDGIERCNDYRCFWSLNFAMRRATSWQPAASTSAISAMAARTPISARRWTGGACRSPG